MDTSINPVSGTNQNYFPSAAKISSSATDTDTQPVKPFAPKTDTTDTGATPSAGTAAAQYETALRQAALSFKDTYAVSDHDFTIFKDATGKYITRYVSLRDGKVTYIPEPTLIKMMQISGSSASPHITINA